MNDRVHKKVNLTEERTVYVSERLCPVSTRLATLDG